MIEGYFGRPGAGKTYSVVERCLRLRGKVRLYSNMEGCSEWMEYIETPADVKKVKDGLLVLDELPMWYASRSYRENPADELKVFAQSRKRAVHMLYTAQNPQQVDASIRRLTSCAYDNRRYGPFVVCTVVDPQSGERFGFRVLKVQAKVFSAYDTFELIQTRGELGQAAEVVPLEIQRARSLVARGCFTESEVCGRVQWSPATLENVLAGHRVLEYWEGEWRDVDTSKLIWQAAPAAVPAEPGPQRRRPRAV